MNSTFKSQRSEHIVRASGQSLSVILFNIGRWYHHTERNRGIGTQILKYPRFSGYENCIFRKVPKVAGT